MSINESEKIKEIPKVTQQEQPRERPPKMSQSAFDKVLEQSKLLQQSPLNVQVVVQKGSEREVKEVRREQEGQKGRDRDSEEKKEEKAKERAREKSESGRTATREAVGKARGMKGFTGGGQGRRGGGGLGYEGRQRIRTQQLKRASDARIAEGNVKNAEFSAKLKAAEKADSARMVQEIVNKIIQAVRVGINPEGYKEIQLDLRERFFKGLRLRLTSKRGKVSIQFLTSTAEVKDLFEKSAPEIRKQLEEKGVAVEEIMIV